MDHPTATIRLGWLAVAALCLVTACGGVSSTESFASGTIRPVASFPEQPGASTDHGTHVVLTSQAGHDVTIDIDDASGLLRDATSGTPGDGASVEPYRVVVSNDDPSTLRLTWSGGPCDLADSLSIDRTGRALLLVEPGCPGDAVAFDRVLLLHLTGPIDATEVHAVLQDGLDTDG
jgi:hypothetical protein